MTFAIYILLVLGAFIGLLNLLPTAQSLGFSFEPAVATIVGYMKAWDFMFPIHELMAFVVIFVTFEIAVWGWHTGWKVIKFLRGHSDGS